MILSPSQEEAKTKISKFLNSYDISNNMFILEGSAGTGKSTTITQILSNEQFADKKIAYSATTNKAVSVLKQYSNNGFSKTVPSGIPNLFVSEPVAMFLTINSIGKISAFFINCSLMLSRLIKCVLIPH